MARSVKRYTKRYTGKKTKRNRNAKRRSVKRYTKRYTGKKTKRNRNAKRRFVKGRKSIKRKTPYKRRFRTTHECVCGDQRDDLRGYSRHTKKCKKYAAWWKEQKKYIADLVRHGILTDKH